MSITPDKAPESALASDPNALFLQRTDEINDLLNSGASLSGHEPNCFFLNTQSSQFATASATSGFDYSDDARAVVRTDWDGDGDVDLWFANRSAPRLRFMRNNANAEDNTNVKNHFVAFRLRGVTSNRDGIGARVEVHRTTKKTRLVKTLQAADGFLSQSTKWIHFGLGQDTNVNGVTVHWPGAATERFSIQGINRRYVLRQGSGNALDVTKDRSVNLRPFVLTTPDGTDRAAVRLTNRMVLPRLEYLAPNQKPTEIEIGTGRHKLITLWASWCPSCQGELSEFRDHADQLDKAGIDLLLLSVDHLSANQETPPADREQVWRQIGLQAERGQATSELSEKLRLIANQVVGQYDPLPVPSSFLIDGQGRLAAFYRGTVAVERLIQDAELGGLSDDRLFQAALPHRGLWVGPRRMYSPRSLALALVEGGFLDDALTYARRQRDLFSSDETYAEVFSQAGNALTKQGRFDKALTYYDESLKALPNSPAAHFNRALALHRSGKVAAAKDAYRRVIELDDTTTVAHLNLGALLFRDGKRKDGIEHLQRSVELNPSLAVAQYHYGLALAQIGNSAAAIDRFRRAMLLAPDHCESRLQLGKQLAATGDHENAIKELTACLQQCPKMHEAHFELAVAYERQRTPRRAVEFYRTTLQLSPTYLPAQNNLAWLLATHPDSQVRNGRTALDLARRAAQATQGRHPAILDTLAAALAESGDFDQAVATTTRAIELLPPKGADAFRRELLTRRELYRSKRAYRVSATP